MVGVADGHAAVARVWIEGQPLTRQLDAMLDEVVVDQDVHVPDMATLRFRDSGRNLADGEVSLGDRLQVKAGSRGGRATTEIFVGEVTAIEGHYDATGNVVVVRAYDLEHRLHRGRRTKTYHNVKDSDLVRSVAQEAGLQAGSIDDSRIVHEHVSRTNQSGYEFLRARASEVGFTLDVDDGKVNFHPRRGTRRPSASLSLGETLESFFPRLSAAEQVAEVEVRSWDPATKQAIVGRAAAETDSATVLDKAASVAKKFPEECLVEVGRPLATAAEVDAVAEAVADEIAGTFAQANGVAMGDPALRSGVAIEIDKVGRRFDGTYTLTSCRHRFVGGHYRTAFVVSGRQRRSLLGLASLGEANRLQARARVNGVVIGEVTDIDDPQALGRVKVRFPWLSDDYESPWARLSMFGAGEGRGALFIPEVGDEVLLAFEHGDVRSPYVLGGLYNGVDLPADGMAVDGGLNHRRSITSRGGHQFVMCDERGAEEVIVKTGDDSVTVTMSQANTSITISSSGDVVIEGASNVSIEAGSDLTLKAGGNIEVEARGRLAMQGGAGVDISSNNPTSISGTPIKLN